MRRRTRWTAVTMGVALWMVAAPSGAQDGVRIAAVSVSVEDSVVVCRVETSGMPDLESRETLASGLPSAFLLSFSLLNEAGNELRGSEAQFRIEPDLWENNFLVRSPARDQRLPTLEDVRRSLVWLEPTPVAPLEALTMGAPYRMRVRLAVFPLAPAELERARDLFTGQTEYDEPGRREVSMGLGSLIRYFMGGPDLDAVVDEMVSERFTRDTMPRTDAPATPGDAP